MHGWTAEGIRRGLAWALAEEEKVHRELFRGAVQDFAVRLFGADHGAVLTDSGDIWLDRRLMKSDEYLRLAQEIEKEVGQPFGFWLTARD